MTHVERHMQEPDQTMRSYRAIDPGNKHGACLGMHSFQPCLFSFFFALVLVVPRL